TPTSELMGAQIWPMPSAGPELQVLLPPPGESVGVLPLLSTMPVTVKVRTDPGTRLIPASTGDCAGALSPLQHVVPLGMPARYGSDDPGTDRYDNGLPIRRKN